MATKGKTMNILITGGAGYIGSVVTEECVAAGHNTFVIDNLVSGHKWMVHPNSEFYEADIRNTPVVNQILQKNRIEAVIHMAAFSVVGDSMSGPYGYYDNNVSGGLLLLDAMRESGVKKIIFSSTAAVYGEPEEQPIEESVELRPTNAYGETKLAFEKALKWFDYAHGIKYTILRYFNAAGASQRCGELHKPETHLIPLVLEVARGRIPVLQIYGNDYPTKDGTCIRDYVHVRDLARAHILGLESLEKGSDVYNLGSGRGFTVREVIDAARKVTDRLIPVIYSDRRDGDPPILVASPAKIIQKLGWTPDYSDLTSMIESAWKWGNDHHHLAKASGEPRW